MEWSSINCWLRALRNLTNFDQKLSPLRNVRQIGTKPSGSQVHWSLFSNLCFYPHENSFRLSFYTSTLSYVGTLRAFGLEVFTQVFLFFFRLLCHDSARQDGRKCSSTSLWRLREPIGWIFGDKWCPCTTTAVIDDWLLWCALCFITYPLSAMFPNCTSHPALLPDNCQFQYFTALFCPVESYLMTDTTDMSV